MKSPREARSSIEFSLVIFSIKLQVKFPCTMVLQNEGRFISQQINPRAHVFSFNQQVQISTSGSQDDIEINVLLGTEKGGNILAGVIPLSVEEVKELEGEKLSKNLKKCLDGTAFAQLQIVKVFERNQKPVRFTKSVVGPINKPETRKNQLKNVIENIETKSEYGLNLYNSRRGSPLYRSRLDADKKQRMVETKVYSPRLRVMNEDHLLEPDLRSPERKYGKDRSGLKKEFVSETENNLKLDLAKIKLKNQELEKIIMEKNKFIKENKDSILDLQRKLVEKQYSREELLSKETAIKILQDRVHNLTNENVTLRESLSDYQKQISQLKDNIRFDIIKNKEEYEDKENVLRNELLAVKNRIGELELDISNKGSQLAKAKKYIEDLQNSYEDKILQHDKILSQLKKANSKTVGESIKKVADLDQKVAQFTEKLNEKINENTKLTDQVNRKQQENQRKQLRIVSLQHEKTELLSIKSSYEQLTKKYNQLEEVQRDEQKKHQKNLNLKQKEVEEQREENRKSVFSLEEKIAGVHEKSLQLKKKISQLENSLISEKSQVDKLKKQLQKAEKSLQHSQEKQAQVQREKIHSYQRIQKLQKEVHEKGNTSVNSESLFKMQIQHNRSTISRITRELEELQSKFSTARDQAQFLKSEKTKLQNKIGLLEDQNARLIQDGANKKEEFDKKQQEYKEGVKSLNKRIKQLEEEERQKLKEINGMEIKTISLKNTIQSLKKEVSNGAEKIEKLQNVVIPKLKKEKQITIEEKEKLKEQIASIAEQNKQIINERMKLESETNKNAKMHTVLSGQKNQAINELKELKTALSKAEKSNESLMGEIKSLGEENKRNSQKNEILQKENQTTKEVMNGLISNLATMSIQKSMQVSRKKSSFENLNLLEMPRNLDIQRISEIINTNHKQQHSTISDLEESLRQSSKMIDSLEKQVFSLTQKIRTQDEKNSEIISRLSEQLEIIHERMFLNSNQHEDAMLKMQNERNRKDKELKNLKETILSLKFELDIERRKNQGLIDDNTTSQTKFNNQIDELLSKLHFHQMNMETHEQNSKKLQHNIQILEDQILRSRNEIVEKENEIYALNEQLRKAKLEGDNLFTLKKQQNESIMSLKEEINALKQDNLKAKQLLKEEELNKGKLQEFANSVIKEKQVIVKNQLEISAKVIEFQGKIIDLSATIQNLEEAIKEKDQQLISLKNTNKEQVQNLKILEKELAEEKDKSSQLGMRLKEKEKQALEKDSEIEELKVRYDGITSKNKKQIKDLKEEIEVLEEEKKIIIFEKNSKFQEYEENKVELEEQLGRKNEELVRGQEVIFFERQKTSLAESTINHLKKDIAEYRLTIENFQFQIQQLNEELKSKEETLYQFSGKAHQLESMLADTQAKIPLQLGRLDDDWQNRHDEICEEYEQKIEMLQKDKNYLVDRLRQEENEKLKVIEEKDAEGQVYEKEILQARKKEKELQSEKLGKETEKNREIEKMKEEILRSQNELKKQKIEMKRKDEEIKIKEQAILKLQGKIDEGDKNLNSTKRKYEEEIVQLRNRETLLKNHKEELKGVQWEIQRQVKKLTQEFLKKIVKVCPGAKEQLVESIHSFEHSISTAISFNY